MHVQCTHICIRVSHPVRTQPRPLTHMNDGIPNDRWYGEAPRGVLGFVLFARDLHREASTRVSRRRTSEMKVYWASERNVADFGSRDLQSSVLYGSPCRAKLFLVSFRGEIARYIRGKVPLVIFHGADVQRTRTSTSRDVREGIKTSREKTCEHVSETQAHPSMRSIGLNQARFKMSDVFRRKNFLLSWISREYDNTRQHAWTRH